MCGCRPRRFHCTAALRSSTSCKNLDFLKRFFQSAQLYPSRRFSVIVSFGSTASLHDDIAYFTFCGSLNPTVRLPAIPRCCVTGPTHPESHCCGPRQRCPDGRSQGSYSSQSSYEHCNLVRLIPLHHTEPTANAATTRQVRNNTQRRPLMLASPSGVGTGHERPSTLSQYCRLADGRARKLCLTCAGIPPPSPPRRGDTRTRPWRCWPPGRRSCAGRYGTPPMPGTPTSSWTTPSSPIDRVAADRPFKPASTAGTG